ncbi:hypothetical protein TI39_contig4202g00036 [Zymoseptoria brevis]|uniref:Uncharacterized protein n=1 Tax=Zymoseptoria brevis TaxID=1047168 RepID=A0A0F4GAC2_9PEZI|nr:hypothetical protein TI39_contig4202g00036 [Zymoseptoria brevis]
MANSLKYVYKVILTSPKILRSLVFLTSPKILRSLVFLEFNASTIAMPIGSPVIVLTHAAVWSFLDRGRDRRSFAHAVDVDGMHHLAYDYNNFCDNPTPIAPLITDQLDRFFLPNNTSVRFHAFNHERRTGTAYWTASQPTVPKDGDQWTEFSITVKQFRFGEFFKIVKKIGSMLTKINVKHLDTMVASGAWKKALKMTKNNSASLSTVGSLRSELGSEPILSIRAWTGRPLRARKMLGGGRTSVIDASWLRRSTVERPVRRVSNRWAYLSGTARFICRFVVLLEVTLRNGAAESTWDDGICDSH